MSAAKIKGSLLEYLVRRILTNCGFTKVTPDGKYIFEDRGLNFIHGKGAAHDADVLMNPPIQIPFSYPYRINFECKANSQKTGLSILRNALGLRYDINEFEILTEEQLVLRQNQRRHLSAVADRIRYNYQIGVASVEDYTKNAFEFAANNKIPLISLRWFLDTAACDLFHEITDAYLNRIFNDEHQKKLLRFLKGNNRFEDFFTIETESHIKTIIQSFRRFENRVIIGLLESGDMVFLISETDIDFNYFMAHRVLNGQYHYSINENSTFWEIEINNHLRLHFYLPDRIVNLWREQNYNAQTALALKQRWFFKMFIFFGNNYNDSFRIVNIDQEWLERII